MAAATCDVLMGRARKDDVRQKTFMTWDIITLETFWIGHTSSVIRNAESSDLGPIGNPKHSSKSSDTILSAKIACIINQHAPHARMQLHSRVSSRWDRCYVAMSQLIGWLYMWPITIVDITDILHSWGWWIDSKSYGWLDRLQNLIRLLFMDEMLTLAWLRRLRTALECCLQPSVTVRKEAGRFRPQTFNPVCDVDEVEVHWDAFDTCSRVLQIELSNNRTCPHKHSVDSHAFSTC